MHTKESILQAHARIAICPFIALTSRYIYCKLHISIQLRIFIWRFVGQIVNICYFSVCDINYLFACGYIDAGVACSEYNSKCICFQQPYECECP